MSVVRKVDAAEYIREICSKDSLPVTKTVRNYFFTKIDGRTFQIVIRIPQESKTTIFPVQDPVKVEASIPASIPIEATTTEPKSSELPSDPSEYTTAVLLEEKDCCKCKDSMEEGTRVFKTGNNNVCEVCFEEATA